MKQGKFMKAARLYKKLLRKENEKSCFRGFAQEIEKLLNGSIFSVK